MPYTALIIISAFVRISISEASRFDTELTPFRQDFIMNSESSGKNKQYYDLYAQYKKTESLTFDVLFHRQPWRDWSLKQFLSTAACATPMLPQRKRESLICSFERSIKDRQEWSLRFRSAPWQTQRQHDKWIELLHSVTGMLREDLSGSVIALQAEVHKDSSRKELSGSSITPQSEVHEDSSSKELSGSAIASQAEVLEDSRSIGEIIFIEFEMELKQLVDRAVDVWPRAVRGEIRLSTASTPSTS